MTKTTIAGMRGTPLPNLEAHGLARRMKMATAPSARAGPSPSESQRAGPRRHGA